MSKLVKSHVWSKETFEEKSRPTKAMIVEWISEEKIPGRLIGTEPYVDADAFALGAACSSEELGDQQKLTLADLLS